MLVWVDGHALNRSVIPAWCFGNLWLLCCPRGCQSLQQKQIQKAVYIEELGDAMSYATCQAPHAASVVQVCEKGCLMQQQRHRQIRGTAMMWGRAWFVWMAVHVIRCRQELHRPTMHVHKISDTYLAGNSFLKGQRSIWGMIFVWRLTAI